MEVVLKANDARSWIYRGEGAANLVLAYIGSSPRFVGKVLRIQKISRNGSMFPKATSAFTKHECLLWKEVEELVSAPTRELAEQAYVQHVMSPLLGSEHVDAGILVRVTREFLETVEKNVSRQRPSWRVDDAAVNTQCDSALVISDHSVFPLGVVKEEFCIAVEIKPKCGFLPLSSFIADENIVKRCTTRFKMHQALKLHQRKISQLSEYDPLDLFSGSRDRVHKAIKALLVTPQNNFRVFLNGSLIFGGMEESTDSNNFLAGQVFEDALKCVIQAENGKRTANFLHLISEAILRSGLLDRLVEAQKLDIFDIEGAIHAYYDVMGQPCMVCKELVDAKRSSAYTSLHSIPLDESLKIVRDYLIAATAKDLSMMICFRPRQNRDLGSPFKGVLLESNNQIFYYKVSCIDLDMKPLKKMEFYYQLDRKIVSYYNRTVKIGHHSGKSVSIEENSYRDQSRALEDASIDSAVHRMRNLDARGMFAGRDLPHLHHMSSTCSYGFKENSCLSGSTLFKVQEKSDEININHRRD